MRSTLPPFRSASNRPNTIRDGLYKIIEGVGKQNHACLTLTLETDALSVPQPLK